MFTQFKKPIIFGHRGACAQAPENTIASFHLAVEQGADFIELDAKLSSDGEVMVIHDQTVDRTTDGTGAINQLTLAQLKALDAGSKFNPQFAGEKIPTLDEVFKEVGKDILINVELTNYASQTDGLLPKVAELVKDNHLEERILFSSFLPGNLTLIKKLLPQAPVALLCSGGFAGSFSRSIFCEKISPEIIHPNLLDVNDSYIKKEHERGRRVHVWTVIEKSDMERLFELGVDGIITDDPLVARQVLNQVK